MPEACYDPVRLAYHGWKKKLVGPIERWALRRCDVLVATCEAEKNWISSYLLMRQHNTSIDFVGEASCLPAVRQDAAPTSCNASRHLIAGAIEDSTVHLRRRPKPAIEITDIKRFFKLDSPIVRPKADRHLEPLHVLYLGRRHPLKGVEYLEQAVKEINDTWHKYQPNTPLPIELRIESNVFGEEKEMAWEWCDVLCLPTLSDNLGLVIAEAIEHGRSVITTDGAPAWEPEKVVKKVVSGQRLAVSDELLADERLADEDDYSALSPDSKNASNMKEAFNSKAASIQNALTYLRGYRDGTDRQRIDLLKEALKQYVD